MNPDFPRHQLIIFCLLLSFLTAGYASAEVRNGTIGEPILLSGTAPAFDIIYLFMTGPGVPQYGSRMDSSVSPVVTGEPDTFTQVPVGADGWSYTWQTGKVSGGLAPGYYTVYAATAPAAADALSGIPYSTTDIFLSRPVTTGTLLIRSVPPGAQVEINGKYYGNTPLDLPDLAPGGYRVTISLQGYVPATDLYDLSAGETKQISMKLVPRDLQTVPSVAPETSIPESTEPATPVSPTRATLSTVPAIAGICIGITVSRWLFRR